MLRETTPPTWLIVAFVGVFLLFSAHFLYFFVDDEAITFVYARNLVRGDGLVYNHIEPRAEGYSNFLHVLVASVIFAVVRGVGWPLETVFSWGRHSPRCAVRDSCCLSHTPCATTRA